MNSIHFPIMARITGIPVQHLKSIFPEGLYGVKHRGSETYAIIGTIKSEVVIE